jgi:hypothetical protein
MDPEPRRTPASIHVAALSLLLFVSVQAGLAFLFSTQSSVGVAQYAFAAAVFALLLWGVFRGYRLAWLWGRYLTLVLGILLGASLVVAWARSPPSWLLVALVALGMVVPLLATSLALGRASALRFFDLVCPLCGTRANRPKDFLFRQARCPKCANVW